MRRRSLIWLALTLIVAAAFVGLWVRSYYTVSAVAKYSATSRWWVGLERGELVSDRYSDAHFQDASQGWQWLNYPASTVKRAPEFPRVLGFSFGHPRRQAVAEAPLPVYRHFFSIPLWFITAVTVALLLQLWRAMTRPETRRARRVGSNDIGASSPAMPRRNAGANPVDPQRTSRQ